MKDLIKIYTDEIHFLLKMKEAIGTLHNRIHDKLALIAIEKLKKRFPNIEFRYVNAGVAGLDIQGFIKNKRVLIGEVKGTLLDTSDSLRGPQKLAIEKDLKRLSAEKNIKHKFLIVLSEKTRKAIERQLKTRETFPYIEIMDALADEELKDINLATQMTD